VNGTYSVEKGVLVAADLKAELNNGSLKNGTLKIALGKGDGLFHFDADTALTAEAAQQLLRSFVKEQTFPLDRLRDLRGTVSGKVDIGDSTAVFGILERKGYVRFRWEDRPRRRPAVDLALKVMPAEWASETAVPGCTIERYDQSELCSEAYQRTIRRNPRSRGRLPG